MRLTTTLPVKYKAVSPIAIGRSGEEKKLHFAIMLKGSPIDVDILYGFCSACTSKRHKDRNKKRELLLNKNTLLIAKKKSPLERPTSTAEIEGEKERKLSGLTANTIPKGCYYYKSDYNEN